MLHTHTDIQTYRHTQIHTYTHTHRKKIQPRHRWRNMNPMPLGLFVRKLQPKVGLGGYDILIQNTFCFIFNTISNDILIIEIGYTVQKIYHGFAEPCQ